MVLKPKYSYAEARDMILRGDWRTFIKDLQEWVIYAKEREVGVEKEILKRTKSQSA